MDNSIDRAKLPVEELRLLLSHARLCHEAWWFFSGEQPSRESIVRIYNRYSSFFGAVEPALYVCFVLKLAAVFDENKNSVSLKIFPKYEEYPGFRDLWERGRSLYKYRSKTIAHVSRSKPKETCIDTLNVTYDDLKKLLDDACKVFDSLAADISEEPTYPFTCESDLHLLVQELNTAILKGLRPA